MRYFYLLLFFIGFNTGVNAQYIPVNQYFTVIKTSQGTLKGTLQHVTDSAIYITNEHGEAEIPYQIIKKVMIKNFKRTQMLAAQDSIQTQKAIPNEEIQNDHSRAVMNTAMVVSTVANQVAFTTSDRDTYYTASAISIAAPILGFLFKDAFSSLDKFIIKQNLKNFSLCKPEMEIYSVKYQIH